MAFLHFHVENIRTKLKARNCQNKRICIEDAISKMLFLFKTVIFHHDEQRYGHIHIHKRAGPKRIFLLLMGHPKQHNLVIAPEIGMIYEYIKTRTKNRKTSAIKTQVL